MGNWVSRLLGKSEKKPTPSAAPKPASRPSASAADNTASQNWQPKEELHSSFLRWLLNIQAPQDDKAITPMEKTILDGLERLARTNESGADLIPRVPSVIPQLLQSLHNENISGAELSAGIARDVALVAEVIRQANSSYYQPRAPITSIENAVMVLGKNGLRMLIAKAAFRPVIHVQAGQFTKIAAPRLWEQSEKCAQACRLLAQGARIDAFDAFLAGLMQNVGMIVAFRLIDQVQDGGVIQGSEEFCRRFGNYARTLSHQIAVQWGLPEAVISTLSALRETGVDATSPLANIVFTSDQLSKLRMLIDAGFIEKDSPATAGMPEALQRCLQDIGVSSDN